MWPWEHLAFGYLLWSGYARLWRRRVDAAEALAVAVGTQLPDLVDKPLAWTFEVLPSGVSFAHSLSFGVPATAVVLALGRRVDRPGAARAFVVAYASHLFGDALYPVVRGGSFSLEFVLWPLVPAAAPERAGLVANVRHYLDASAATLATTRGRWYLVAEAVLLGAALALWVADGAPVVAAVLRRDGDRRR